MRRDRVLFVRINQYEHDLLVRAAADRCLPLADYVRMLLRTATDALPLSAASTSAATEGAGKQARDERERERARANRAAAGPRRGRGGKKTGGGKLPPAIKGKSRDRLAARVGVSGKTLEKARAVVKAAEREPEKYAALVAE